MTRKSNCSICEQKHYAKMFLRAISKMISIIQIMIVATDLPYGICVPLRMTKVNVMELRMPSVNPDSEYTRIV